jgi:hypothetical protein
MKATFILQTMLAGGFLVVSALPLPAIEKTGPRPEETCSCPTTAENPQSRCYAITAGDTSISRCGMLPGSWPVRLETHAMPLESHFEFFSRNAQAPVTIQYFKDAPVNPRISLGCPGGKDCGTIEILEKITVYGRVFIGDLEVNRLVSLKKTIRENPQQTFSISLKNQNPVQVRFFLQFLSNRPLTFKTEPTGGITFEASKSTLDATIAALGLH